MTISWMTLRDLEYIVAVGEQKHFGRAARSCAVSQPALSAQLRKFEDRLGGRLFERSKRKVLITALGERVVPAARAILDQSRELLRLAQDERKPLSGRLRLGAIATIGPYLFPRILGPLRKRHPELDLQIREGLTDQLLAELKAGRLDAVIASPTFEEPGLEEVPLYFEEFLLEVASGHSLASKQPLRAGDLDPEEMVLLEDGHCLRDQALSFCPARSRSRGRTPRQFHATSLETLHSLVASGAGYTLLPSLALRERDQTFKGLLERRRFAGGKVGREVILVHRKGSGMERDWKVLSQLIRESGPEGRAA